MAKRKRRKIRWPKFIESKSTREKLTFVGAGFAALVGGAWVVFTSSIFQHAPSWPIPSFSACITEDPSSCPAGTLHIPGGLDAMSTSAHDLCKKFEDKKIYQKEEKRSGYWILNIVCPGGSHGPQPL